jgi:hypothetical protein
MFRLQRHITLFSLILILGGCGVEEPAVEGDISTPLRRLTEAQYRNAIADIFGNSIVVSGRFDPLERVDGMLAIGSSNATITPAALERYDSIARSVALQVVDSEHRDVLIPCQPKVLDESDAHCATTFFNAVGRLVFRRPLSQDEKALYVKLAGESAEELGSFYQGLAYSLAGMLVSPKFLFISSRAEPDPESPGQYRLDSYSKAARLSYLLWNTTPDSVLLNAAASGELHTEDGLERQYNRMMLASSRVEHGLRAFFSDMLQFEKFETLEKDPVIFPAFSTQVAIDAREQTLKTLTHLLLSKGADYREIFTTRETYMSGALGYIYRVPVKNPTGWERYDFSSDSPWAGIHSHLSVQALFSHPGKSSPTLRGKAVRELLLCQHVPDPPGDVDFSDFSSATHAVASTARERLAVHNEEPSCAGCHKLMDPIGLGLENFDGIGQFRSTDEGAPIDAAGELDGIPFHDSVSLGQALYKNAAATECVTQRMYAYAAGRSSTRQERAFVSYLEGQFADADYSLPELMRTIVLSKAFYRAAPPAMKDVAVHIHGRVSQEEDKS